MLLDHCAVSRIAKNIHKVENSKFKKSMSKPRILIIENIIKASNIAALNWLSKEWAAAQVSVNISS